MARIIPGMRVVLCWGEMQVVTEAPGSYAPDGMSDLMGQAIRGITALVEMDDAALAAGALNGVEVTVAGEPMDGE